MDVSWTTAAWELLLPVGAAPARGRGRLLRAALREAVRGGSLPPGTRMPSSRDLARDLGVSRGLVTEAYAQLHAEGYLVSRQGAGTWVATPRVRPRPHPGETPAGPPPTTGPPPVDLRPGLPDLRLFPRTAWAAAQRRVLDRLVHQHLGYPDPRGLPELRAALADLLVRRRGVAVRPDDLVVCSGVAQALALLARVLRDRGHRAVAVEDPGSPPEHGLLALAGLRTVPVPVHHDGIDVAALAAGPARVAVVTPAHQFPTGIAYPPPARAALLDWARARAGLVVEDDYDGDFRYDREPVGALQGLDPEHVAYTGSVSKSLAPGLRLGWLVAPPDLREEVVAVKRLTDLGNPVPDQAALADLIRGGGYDRHLRRCQRAYRQRRDVLVAALERHFPDARVSGVAAGLHAVVEFPGGPTRRAAMLDGAARSGVRLHPLADYRHAGAPPPGDDGPWRVVLGYAHLTPGEIERAVRRLAHGVLAGRPSAARR
ncbi:MocR-like pyridoxine biosynthesis transcription factor PdxR [Allostreptomyces psammosilenae]|uniref:GntR family transcriptional regulator/MocR family aminotransferase n=1 Tax=Allostreptomyces psammosilenae TaxID=1892865 RepID=A0A852ZQW8_9ACTN|nr:PLP-dependent aminotransferase family protein [Allostreptomyces psammosilenae]NYI04793.1 GntR family transcriptional regulator/MocR family aminotransferase [Allostreptomyces psammosilenae]